MKNSPIDMKEVILLLSGGKDSFLSACYLIEDGYIIHMITFENGAGLNASSAGHGAKRIIEKYGQEKANFLGVYNTSGIWREFFLPYLNLKPSEVSKEYGEITVSQFNCLTCRTAMYILSIIIAKQKNINIIADGARENQGFVIEQVGMTNKYKDFFASHSITHLLPVIKLKSDWERKNQLLLRGFVPKTLEPQCLLGAPLPDGKAPDQEVQKGVENFFERIVIPRAMNIIKDNMNVKFCAGGML